MIGTIIGGALGAAGGLFGGLSRNKMIKQQLEEMARQRGENQAWYDRRYNEDATQRADAQRIISMTEEAMKRRGKAAAGAAAVMGSSDEAVAAANESGNKAVADAAAQIAATADRRKDVIEQQFRTKQDNIDNAMRELKGQRHNALDIANDMIGGAANGVASSF